MQYKHYEDLLLSLKSFNEGINSFTYGVGPYLELSQSIKEGKELNPEVFKESAKNLEISYEYFDSANKILQDKIIDSTNVEYKENVDFIVTNHSNYELRYQRRGKL